MLLSRGFVDGDVSPVAGVVTEHERVDIGVGPSQGSARSGSDGGPAGAGLGGVVVVGAGAGGEALGAVFAVGGEGGACGEKGVVASGLAGQVEVDHAGDAAGAGAVLGQAGAEADAGDQVGDVDGYRGVAARKDGPGESAPQQGGGRADDGQGCFDVRVVGSEAEGLDDTVGVGDDGYLGGELGGLTAVHGDGSPGSWGSVPHYHGRIAFVNLIQLISGRPPWGSPGRFGNSLVRGGKVTL